VTVQLVDADTGHHVWAERYDRSVADIFDIQDEITRSVAASTETQILIAGDEAVKSRPSVDRNARDLVMRGMSMACDETLEAYAAASALAEETILIDPAYPRAHILLGTTFVNRMALGELPHDSANIARGLELARTALRLDPRDELAHWLMAMALGHAGKLDDAVAACERGLSINPNSSAILMDMGSFLAFLGRPEDAIAACRLTLRLNPRDPSNYWCHSAIATAHFVAADYEAALQEAKKVARWQAHILSGVHSSGPQLPRPWKDPTRRGTRWSVASPSGRTCVSAVWCHIACCGSPATRITSGCWRCSGRLVRISSVVPHFMLRFARDEDHERLLAMFRKAGLPE